MLFLAGFSKRADAAYAAWLAASDARRNRGSAQGTLGEGTAASTRLAGGVSVPALGRSPPAFGEVSDDADPADVDSRAAVGSWGGHNGLGDGAGGSNHPAVQSLPRALSTPPLVDGGRARSPPSGNTESTDSGAEHEPLIRDGVRQRLRYGQG